MPTDELDRDCPASAQGGACKGHPSYGGGLGVRVGYSFGWLAVEGVALGGDDAWYDKARYEVATTAAESAFYGPPRTERYTFARYGGALCLGARVSTPTAYVRGTLGFSFGVLQGWQRYFRIASTVTRVTTPAGTTSIPDAVADASEVDSSVAQSLRCLASRFGPDLLR